MNRTQPADAHLAIDLGAESGRAMLGAIETGSRVAGGGAGAGDEVLGLVEVHRFPTTSVERDDGPRWDIDGLFDSVLEGLRRAAAASTERGRRLASIGVDTWGVDYALIDGAGALIDLPRCYRDARHETYFRQALERLGAEHLYARTGIQLMNFNTLFQLMGHVACDPEHVERAERLLFMPDLFHERLAGIAANEATMVSTTQMTDVQHGAWDHDLLASLGVPSHFLGEVVPPGTVLGPLLPEHVAAAGLSEAPLVVAPASHDTASAFAAVPADPGTRWCCLSSGTWSCLGADLDRPCLDGRDAPFTNERGVGGRVRFLQNIAGLWLVQEVRHALAASGIDLDYAELTALAGTAAPHATLVNTRHAPLFEPGDMPAKIAAYARRTSQPIPASPGELVRCCLESLALAYRRALGQLETLLEDRFDVVHIVGGGGRNDLLNRMTADATGRRVVVGPYEATATGNVLVQAMALGRVADVEHLRRIVRDSGDLQVLEPNRDAAWDEAARRYERLPE
ncbi:MAG: rhamnulokinase [Planctomycetota bacterium]